MLPFILKLSGDVWVVNFKLVTWTIIISHSIFSAIVTIDDVFNHHNIQLTITTNTEYYKLQTILQLR